MVDETEKKKFWRRGFAQNVAASLLAAAIWAIGSAIASFAGARLTHASAELGTTINASLLLVGVYIMALAAYLTTRWLPRRETRKSETMAFRIFLEDAEFLLRVYRSLGFDDPQNTRLPLNRSSWPNFNPPVTWTFTEISLFSLSVRLDWLVMVASRTFAEMGWTDYVELFSLPRESTVMVDLIAALENFRDLLREKIALLTTK